MNTFDPYQLLVNKKEMSHTNEDDIYNLQEFCRTHGIFGFNLGNIDPKVALKLLKSQMGIQENPSNQNSKKNLLLG
jgi:hypothetical protein